MGVFDFLKKGTQNDDDDGQDQSQTYTPMQTQAAPQSDVQASYGSFFSSTKPAANVTYPLPAAGAALTPNYGAGVPVPPSDDTDDSNTTTSATVTTNTKPPVDKLDITNTSYVVEDKTSLPPVQVTDDPLLIKGDNIIQEPKHDDLFLTPTAPTNVPAPTEAEKAKVDSLDLANNSNLDFNAPLPDLTADISKQLETPLLPGAEPIEEFKSVDNTKTGATAPVEEIKTTLEPETTENAGNDTEVPNNKSFDDFNPPLDSLVINAGNGTQGNWNPDNAFMSASNDGLSDEPKVDNVAEANTDEVKPEVREETEVTPMLNDLVINKEETTSEPKDEEGAKSTTTEGTKEDADSIDWLKDLETQPLDMQPVVETTSKELFPETKPLTSEDDLPEWMKEFESMQFNAAETESAKPEPVKDLVTELPVVDESKKTKKKDTKEEGIADKKVEESKTPAIETDKPQAELQLKYFRDVALVGLNSDSSDSKYSELVKDLIDQLKTSAARLIIDSSQGYGKIVLDSLKDTMNLEINGAYLRPYFSAYSDEPNGEVIDVKNYTETLFSNFIERLRYLYTSAELFIVLDSKGLVNIADISFLLAMQKMYYGKHKPVILFGEGWKDKMDTLGTLLNDDEKDKVYIVKDVNELAGVLKKIEEGYSKNNYYSTKRVTDLRDIEDEKQFMI